MKIYYCLMCLLSLLCGCARYSLSVQKTYVDRSNLASTFVRSPDPLQSHPPTGDRVMIHWRVPKARNDLRLVLSIIYRNHTQETLCYPLLGTSGRIFYSVLDGKYTQTQGILTYKVEIQDEQGNRYKSWQQQLWVEMIAIDNEEIPNAPF